MGSRANRKGYEHNKTEVNPLTEQDKRNVETLVDIINRLPAEDKRVLEAYARGVVDKTEAIKEGGEHNDQT